MLLQLLILQSQIQPTDTTIVIDNILKLAPLGANGLLIIAVIALWKKVNNGYFIALQDLRLQMKEDIRLLRKDIEAVENNLYEILKAGGWERRAAPRRQQT